MKLLKMKCIAEGDRIYYQEETPVYDYMVKLETESERAVYDLLNEDYETVLPIWDTMLWVEQDGGTLRDGHVAYYFMPSEQEPAVGETFESDDIKWKRTA